MGGIRKIGNIVVIRLSDLDSNIYLAGDTVIDSGTGFNFTRLFQALKILNVDVKDIKHIINTHGHFDHIGGNGYFINADIAIHEADAEIVEKADVKGSYADFYDGKLHPREVKIRLKNGDKVRADAMDLEVIHTPGHTPGSICLYEKSSGTLFTGDTVFCDGIGRTDMPGGNDQELKSSIDKIASLQVKRLLPGHGDVVILDSPKTVADIMSSAPSEED
jgi:glyoxylase-like metal-dependent hydrolase (beta-lactamase superfamily II)